MKHKPGKARKGDTNSNVKKHRLHRNQKFVYTRIYKQMKSVNTDIAYDHVRQRILRGDYGPGDALMTEALASEIGVSRTPVRDALRKLEADGLVEIQPRLGARVKQFDRQEYREMCELRLALEAQTAGLAAKNRTPEDLVEIKGVLINLRRLTKELKTSRNRGPKTNKIAKEDVRFHLAIMAASKNALMQREILRLHLIQRVAQAPIGRNFRETASREDQLANHDRVLAEHEAIFAAIADGDARAAKLAMETHIENLLEILLRKLAQEERDRVAQSMVVDELGYPG